MLLLVLAIVVGAASVGMAQTPPPSTVQDCQACHEDAGASRSNGTSVAVPSKPFAESVHGGLACVDCHQDLSAQVEWPHQERLAKVTCITCHEDQIASVADSIHERGRIRSGLTVAPGCATCHGSHEIRPRSDRRSRVHRANVPSTCGSCHEGVERQYQAGIHGTKLSEGSAKAPTCADCHSAHTIRRTDTPPFQLGVVQECGTCHIDKIRTYRDTFHGQVTALGFERVAKCADCHGAHDILPASNPTSSVSEGRLVATCRRCHSGANASFVKYDPHPNPREYARNPVLWWTRRFYMVLISGCFVFFGLHSALWFWRSWKTGEDGR